MSSTKLNNGAKEEMTFMEHLDALRAHLFRSAIAIAIGAVIMAIYSEFIVQRILLGPTRSDFPTYTYLCKLSNYLGFGNKFCMKEIHLEMQSATLTGQFDVYLDVIVIGGFIVAFPYILWQFWKFVKPALNQKELANSRGVILWVSFLFFIGIGFGYFVLSPYTVNFFANFSLDSKIKNIPTISSYFDTVLPLTLGCGLAFQLPLILYFLAKVGIVSATTLKGFRKYAILAIVVITGIITPPDMFSQIICSIPLVVLYEVGIIVCRSVEKKQAKIEAEWE
jgi:sec-independent protein translocase protein TatC